MVRDGNNVKGSRDGACDHKRSFSVTPSPARTPEKPPAFLSCLLFYSLQPGVGVAKSTYQSGVHHLTSTHLEKAKALRCKGQKFRH